MIRTSPGIAVGAVTLMICIAADISAQGTAPDRWKMVPAAPTTCFSDDDFIARLDAAHAAAETEIERQKKVNVEARERFDAMDGAERARRMQAFMMKDPQAAMKMMQAQQAAGASASSSIPAANEAMKQLETELEREIAGFRAAADQAVSPQRARQRAFVDAKAVLLGEAAVPAFKDPAAHAQYVTLIGEENAAYARACAPWFGANGTFHKWLGRYRTEVLDVLVDTDHGDAVVMQMAAMGFESAGYKSTTALEQSRNYMLRMRNLFNVRSPTARASIALVK